MDVRREFHPVELAVEHVELAVERFEFQPIEFKLGRAQFQQRGEFVKLGVGFVERVVLGAIERVILEAIQQFKRAEQFVERLFFEFVVQCGSKLIQRIEFIVKRVEQFVERAKFGKFVFREFQFVERAVQFE